MKHTDAVTSSKGYESHAEVNANGTRSDEGGGGGILAMICASLCKDTPLAEAFADNTNNNAQQGQQLLSPIQNGEQVARESGWNSLWLAWRILPLLESITAYIVVLCCRVFYS